VTQPKLLAALQVMHGSVKQKLELVACDSPVVRKTWYADC
jgi:hypothetical protein